MLSITTAGQNIPKGAYTVARHILSRRHVIRATQIAQNSTASTVKDITTPSESAAREKIDEYFTYFKTKAALRPLVYRAKNASTLMAMDLIDPETNEPITPRKPIVSIPNKLLVDYIKSVNTEGSNEFYEWFKRWTDVTPRKKPIWNYFTPVHLQYMMIQSFFKIGDYARLIGFLYTRWDRFAKAGNAKIFDVEHFFNTYLMCAIQRGKIFEFNDAEKSKRKLLQAWSRTYSREQRTGLCGMLINCFAQQQGFSLSKDGSKAEQELAELSVAATTEGNEKGGVVLPKFDPEVATDPQRFLERNENLYLICRTLLDNALPDNATITTGPFAEIRRFVNEYDKLSSSGDSATASVGIYEDYMESMRKIWFAKKEQAMEREKQQEKAEEEA